MMVDLLVCFPPGLHCCQYSLTRSQLRLDSAKDSCCFVFFIPGHCQTADVVSFQWPFWILLFHVSQDPPAWLRVLHPPLCSWFLLMMYLLLASWTVNLQFTKICFFFKSEATVLSSERVECILWLVAESLPPVEEGKYLRFFS